MRCGILNCSLEVETLISDIMFRMLVSSLHILAFADFSVCLCRHETILTSRSLYITLSLKTESKKCKQFEGNVNLRSSLLIVCLRARRFCAGTWSWIGRKAISFRYLSKRPPSSKHQRSAWFLMKTFPVSRSHFDGCQRLRNSWQAKSVAVECSETFLT